MNRAKLVGQNQIAFDHKNQNINPDKLREEQRIVEQREERSRREQLEKRQEDYIKRKLKDDTLGLALQIRSDIVHPSPKREEKHVVSKFHHVNH